jgi:hypothetical protein
MEPTGLLGLANALVHERRWAEAADVLAKLKQKPWPARFQSAPVNVREQIRALEQKVEQAGGDFPTVKAITTGLGLCGFWRKWGIWPKMKGRFSTIGCLRSDPVCLNRLYCVISPAGLSSKE